MSKELVKKQFGANAAAYATSAVHAQGASLARLVELVQPQPGWRMLDVAAAAGHTAFAFAPHVAQVIATDLTPEMAARSGMPKDAKGVVVSGVAPNGLAAQSGLSRGMVVVQVNKTPVATAAAFRQAVEQSNRDRGAVLHVLRPNGDVDFVILKTQ